MKRSWHNSLVGTARLLAVVGALVYPAPAKGSAFTIEDWVLSVVVSYDWPDIVGASFDEVQNPFNDFHSVALGASTAQASYDFAWSGEAGLGSFLIEAADQAEGVPSSLLVSSSSGFIWITPTEDLSLSIEAAYSYVLPADPMHARLILGVAKDDGTLNLFNEIQQAHTSDPTTPPIGTLNIVGSVTLPAGDTWLLHYSMSIGTYGDTTGYLGTGSGFVDFQITPEPSTFYLLAFGAPALLKRRRSPVH